MFVTGWQSADPTGRKSISEHQQREDLLPLPLIRQMRRLDSDLFHGTLPPLHLRLVHWWKTKELSALVPRGDDGKPLPPPSTGTCPTGEERQSDAEPVIDAAVIADHLASLPRPKTTLDRLGFALSAATKASIKPSDKVARRVRLRQSSRRRRRGRPCRSEAFSRNVQALRHQGQYWFTS